MGDAIAFFRLLQCLCRRAVLLADLNRNALLSLAHLAPTFLVNVPDLPPTIRDLWITSNHRGVYVFGNGRACSLATSKALFLGTTDVRNVEGIHFTLRPDHSVLRRLTENLQSEIAAELQPQFLMLRLRNFERVRTAPPCADSSPRSRPESSLVLERCVMGDADIVASMTQLLRQGEQDAILLRSCDPHFALLEAMWKPCHGEGEITVSGLAELVNTLLRCRGEVWEFSTAEIGWKLRNLGFPRRRNGRGMVLRFSVENRSLLHHLAGRWSLNLAPVAGCALCPPTQAIDTPRLV
jgi:hypothetical protein